MADCRSKNSLNHGENKNPKGIVRDGRIMQFKPGIAD